MSAMSTRVTPSGNLSRADTSATERQLRHRSMMALYSGVRVVRSCRGYGATEMSASIGRSYRGLVRPPVTAYGRTSELESPVSEGGPGGGSRCGPEFDPGRE